MTNVVWEHNYRNLAPSPTQSGQVWAGCTVYAKCSAHQVGEMPAKRWRSAPPLLFPVSHCHDSDDDDHWAKMCTISYK